MTIRIPIRFLDGAGHPVSDPGLGQPFIKVVFQYDADFGKGLTGRTVSNYVEIDALIDTGADLIYADPDIVDPAQCPIFGTAKVYGATASMDSTQHKAHLFFPSFGTQIGVEITRTPLKNNNRSFSLILGIRFLELGSLHLDFSAGDFWFDYDPQSHARIAKTPTTLI